MLRRWLIRNRVNRRLDQRPCLEYEDWAAQFELRSVPPPVANFLWRFLSQCAGLHVGRIRPDDLLTDLGFPGCAYSDWELQLVEDFQEETGVPLTPESLSTGLRTIVDWATFLASRFREHSGPS